MSFTFGPNGRERETKELGGGNVEVHERIIVANGCTFEAHRVENVEAPEWEWIYVLWVGDTYRELTAQKAQLIAAFISEVEAL